MKPIIPFALLGALFAVGAASAATTTPVGYTTQTLAANSFNLVGFNVQSPAIASGAFTGVSGNDVSDTNVNFTTVLPAGKTCVLEITSGAGTVPGTVQEFVTWSGSTITLPVASGAAIGDTYKVRVAPTLQEVFPVGFLAGAIGATNADKVWVPNGGGTYTKYWYKSIAPNIGWHTTTSGTNDTGLVTSDIPLVYIDGVLVEKKTVAKDLVLTGEVKTTGSNVLLTPGFNLVSVNPPVGLTLFTSGLQGDIAGAIGATNADIVWVPAGGGLYTKYWYKSIAPNIGWHITTTGTNDAGLVAVDVPMPPGVYIQRKGAVSKVVSLDVPTSYGSL